MTISNVPNSDYCRYFSHKQKAYLINMSEQRDRDEYESLGGVILDCRGNYVEVQVPYFTEQPLKGNESDKLTYKITTESMGIGLQIAADLLEIKGGNVFCFRLYGVLETYQRRQTPRVDATIKLHFIRQDFSLAAYRKEFRRIVAYRKAHGCLTNLKMSDYEVNLSAGGVRIGIETHDNRSRLLMFFMDLEDGQPPVCALAETVWTRKDDSRLLCGHRFIQILKADQERIGRFVLMARKRAGLPLTASRASWELLDRMIFEGKEVK